MRSENEKKIYNLFNNIDNNNMIRINYDFFFYFLAQQIWNLFQNLYQNGDFQFRESISKFRGIQEFE